MLNITDLSTNKELDCRELAGIRGGNAELQRLAALIDFSTSIYNTVADVKQGFGFNIAQGNSGSMTNNQVIHAGNGVVFAPVSQQMVQGNALSLSDIGNTGLV